LSTDEMTFGDVSYREPERRRRPDRDRRWAALAYELPGPDDLPIFLDLRTADRIERHALRDTSVELGGILLGKECVDDQTGEPYVWVTQALEAKHYENTQASFTYTHDSWEEISRDRDRLHPELDIVGWYHTHPDFGIFLSGHDLFIHEHFFAQPLQVAYVVDPVRQTRGFFRWRDGGLVEVGGYYLTAERGDRIALARTANDLEGLPNDADGGGAGGLNLSPRLEAELIAMLTRPHHAPAAVADRAQLAATFGLLGALGGGLGLALLLWLYSLGHQLQAQALALRDVGVAVESVAREQRARDADAARVGGKEAAIDALLGEVRVGGSKERISRVLGDLVKERDEATTRFREQDAVFHQFGGDLARLQETAKARKEDLEQANKKVEELKKQAGESEDARGKLKDSEARLADRTAELAATSRRLGEITDAKSEALVARYHWAWYAAAAGWAVSLALGVGLVAARARNLPAGDPEPPAGPDAPPPHQIA